MTTIRFASAAIAVSIVTACSSTPTPPARTDTQRIIAADTEPGSWLTHGRTYGEQRFSPLTKVSTETVGRLGLAWTYELKTNRGAQATPLVADGVDVRHLRLESRLRPRRGDGPGALGLRPEGRSRRRREACCDVVNRGVALHDGKVFVGVIDGRLVALDAKTGSVAWETVTVDQSQPYTITGAPRAANGLVYIGNGGAEYGVRGYISAYDTGTGKLRWRFYTVPGDPLKGTGQYCLRPDHGEGRRNVERPVVDAGRRRHGLGRHRLRRGLQSADCRRRQRVAVEPAGPIARRRRQPVPVVHRRARCRDRRLQVALPDDARRHLGLHRDAADRARRTHDRRQATEGRDAGAEERLLLRRGSRERQADLRAAVPANAAGERHTGRAAHQLGVRCRLEPRDVRSRIQRPGTGGRRRWSGRDPRVRTTGTPCPSAHRPASSTCRHRTWRSGTRTTPRRSHARGSAIWGSPSTRFQTTRRCAPRSRALPRACCLPGIRSRNAKYGVQTGVVPGTAGRWPPPADSSSRGQATASFWRST